MNMKKLIVTLVVALITFFGYNSLNAQNMKKEEVPQNISAFPVGKANTGFEQYFTGRSWLAPLTGNKDLNVPMSNVTFEPGCRNNWHSHTGGQLLIAVGGVGYYQERGKASRRLLPGDVKLLRTSNIGMAPLPIVGSHIWLSDAIRRPTRIHGWNEWMTNSMPKQRKIT